MENKSPCLDCEDRLVYIRQDGSVHNCHNECERYIRSTTDKYVKNDIEFRAYKRDFHTETIRRKIRGAYGNVR